MIYSGVVTREIYCCTCEYKVKARLTNGAEIYPGREDLKDLPFWFCVACRSYVGCHHKTADRTRPLGYLCGPEMRYAKRRIHDLLDPIWQSKKMTRTEVYKRLSAILGYEYHTGQIRTRIQAAKVYEAVVKLKEQVNGHTTI